MDAISKDVSIKFCSLCNWVYEAWVTHKALFDENQTPKENIEKSTAFMNRLSIITHEYSLQQIAKLHDPAVQRGSSNLTVSFIVQFGEWGERRGDIERIYAKLLGLSEHLKLARNKILAHNDMETFATDSTLGSFPEGADNEYFENLQALVNEVHEKWIGGPYPFNDLAKADVREFLALLEKVHISS